MIGLWNGVSSNQFGEHTYIWYDKAKGGLKGMTLAEDQKGGWVISYHLYLMDNMFSDKSGDMSNVHKVELSRRK